MDCNLNYWGCNQYITQRALGADLTTARTGILFAGFLNIDAYYRNASWYSGLCTPQNEQLEDSTV